MHHVQITSQLHWDGDSEARNYSLSHENSWLGESL